MLTRKTLGPTKEIRENYAYIFFFVVFLFWKEMHIHLISLKLWTSWNYEKNVLRKCAKFTGKHLCQSLFYNKVATPPLDDCLWSFPIKLLYKIVSFFVNISINLLKIYSRFEQLRIHIVWSFFRASQPVQSFVFLSEIFQMEQDG